MSSLPVPVSPLISTVLFIGDTSSSVVKSACIVLWRPMMFSNRNLPLSCALSSAFSSRSRCCSRPVVQHARELRQLERLDQEVDRAALDRRDRFGDAAEAGHHHRTNLRVAIEGFVEYRHAVGVGQAQVDDESVVGERPQPLDGIGGVAGLRRGKAVGFEAGDDGLAEIEVVFDDENGRQGALAHIFVSVNKSSLDPEVRHPATGASGGKS